MDLEDQFRRYFGTADLAALTPAVLASGIEHLRVDFGMAKETERRFALWSLLHTLDAAPDLDAAFKTEAEREAARNLIALLAVAPADGSLG